MTPALPVTSLMGHAVQDIGSGNCAVHNTMLLDHVQKSVVWAPWRYRPPPFWEPFNRNVRVDIAILPQITPNPVQQCVLVMQGVLCADTPLMVPCPACHDIQQFALHLQLFWDNRVSMPST